MAQVVEETVADDDMIMIKGCKEARAVTVLLRGPNDYMLDEMERSLHDAFCIVKRVLESGEVVPGETPLSLSLSACSLRSPVALSVFSPKGTTHLNACTHAGMARM